MSIDAAPSHMHADHVALDPARAAVVVVDMVNDFCVPGGLMVLPGCDVLFAPQRAVIDAARKTGAPVIWVHDSHRPNLRRDREFLKRARHCRRYVGGRRSSRIRRACRRDPRHQAPLLVVFPDGPRRHAEGHDGGPGDRLRRGDQHLRALDGPRRLLQRLRGRRAARLPARPPVRANRKSTLYDISTHFGIVTEAASVVAALSGGALIENADMAA